MAFIATENSKTELGNESFGHGFEVPELSAEKEPATQVGVGRSAIGVGFEEVEEIGTPAAKAGPVLFQEREPGWD